MTERENTRQRLAIADGYVCCGVKPIVDTQAYKDSLCACHLQGPRRQLDPLHREMAVHPGLPDLCIFTTR